MKKILFAVLCMNSNSRANQCEALYIINSARNCISPKRSFVYHHCERKYSLRLMVYTLKRYDIPLLSQWIKNRQVETCRFLVRVAGLEPVHLSAQEPKGHATSVTSRKPNRIKGFRVLSFLIFA